MAVNRPKRPTFSLFWIPAFSTLGDIYSHLAVTITVSYLATWRASGQRPIAPHLESSLRLIRLMSAQEVVLQTIFFSLYRIKENVRRDTLVLLMRALVPFISFILIRYITICVMGGNTRLLLLPFFLLLFIHTSQWIINAPLNPENT